MLNYKDPIFFCRDHLIACRKERFVGVLNSRTGKRITMADLDHFHAMEDEKEEEIKKVRSTLQTTRPPCTSYSVLLYID